MRWTIVCMSMVLAALILGVDRGSLHAAAASGSSTSTASASSVAREFVEEVYNQQHPDRIAAWIHPDFVDRSPGANPDARGPQLVRTQYDNTYGAFPDLKFTIDLCIATGDTVAMVWRSKGTFSGKLGTVVGKGQPMSVGGISIFRVEGGKIIESWDMVDRLAMLTQAGYTVTPPGQ